MILEKKELDKLILLNQNMLFGLSGLWIGTTIAGVFTMHIGLFLIAAICMAFTLATYKTFKALVKIRQAL